MDAMSVDKAEKQRETLILKAFKSLPKFAKSHRYDEELRSQACTDNQYPKTWKEVSTYRWFPQKVTRPYLDTSSSI
jgi:hypothetical protein